MRKYIYIISMFFYFTLFISNCFSADELINIKPIVIQPPVSSVTFFGNKTFKSKKLQSITKLGERSIFKITQFTEQELEKDVRRIKSFYNSNGFLFVTVEPMVKFGLNKTWAEVIFHVKEGVRTKISNIKYIGIQNFKNFEIESQIKSRADTYLDPFQIIEDKKNILMFYNNHGYIYSAVKHVLQFNEDKSQAEIIFYIDERQIVYVDKIFISGLNLTKEKIVSREIEIEEGDVLLWQKLINTQKNINNLGIFTDVKFEPVSLDETKDRVDLNLYLKEQLPRYLGFGLGYGSIDKERILIEWSHENLFGENQRFNISGTFKSWEDLYQMSFVNPRMFNTHNSLITSASYRRTVREYYKVGEVLTSVDLRRKLIRSIIGSSKYQLQKTNKFNIRDDAPEDVKLEKKVSLTQSFIYTLIMDTRDNILYPHSGITQSLSYQYAGGILSGDNSFKRYVYNSSIFFDIYKELILAYRIQTGFIKEFGRSITVPVEERFHAGGINSIRGYSEKDLGTVFGGNAVLVSNLELRFPIYDKFYGVVFYDAGEIFDKKEEIRRSKLRSSRGIGLRYHTIIIPFRLDYGEKIDRRLGESPGEYYISIGQAF
ncbi:outer membrane protein assembly factor BamA [Candidatus Poribacteria bacterium]|nr:outer membrane protein assembly factor BamA [Candidatus Poribacteria bacterium]